METATTRSWDQARIDQLIEDKIEENLNLEYKSAAALSRSDGRRREITKDISAFANSNGGTLIYGVKEYDEKAKRHLPERFDPVDRTDYSKEWLEQVIDSIRPRLGVKIYSVDLDTGANDVAYVVEIPEGDTAYQANDKRYYKRQNFKSERMEDYEIRLVMGRSSKPELEMKVTIFGSHVLNHHMGSGVGLLISLINTGKAAARAPYLEIFEPPFCEWSRFGVDGNSSEGLPQIAVRKASQVRRMGGMANYIIYPEVELDVAMLIVKSLKDTDLRITYRVAAENMKLREKYVVIEGDLEPIRKPHGSSNLRVA